jgi:nucleolar pre-ribosomal-associated protein 1
MSRSVRRLLSLMRFFEAEKRTSISLFLARWSPSPDTTVTNVLDVAQNSDPIQFLWTFLHSLGDDLAKRKARREAHGCVDIRSAHSDYLIGTDARRVSSHNHIRLGVKVFRTNAATLLIRCLSRKTPTSVRQFSVRLQDFGVLYK